MSERLTERETLEWVKQALRYEDSATILRSGVAIRSVLQMINQALQPRPVPPRTPALQDLVNALADVDGNKAANDAS